MKVRKIARVVLFDSQDRVLLQKIVPLEPLKSEMDFVWICPGEKIEDGESILSCAKRELYEETGIKNCSLGSILWHGTEILKLKGEDTLFDQYFVYARLKVDAILTNGDDPVILENRWWRVEDIASKNINIFPKKLPKLLHTLGQELKGTQEI